MTSVISSHPSLRKNLPGKVGSTSSYNCSCYKFREWTQKRSCTLGPDVFVIKDLEIAEQGSRGVGKCPE
jgi:hypothetical protein